MGIVDGKVVIITGAGRGIGKEHALAFAREGAKVVVNDLGGEVDGSGSSTGPAGEVVEEIRGMGGEAIANGDDVSSWEGAQRMINGAVSEFGRLDVLVNNAGILRDRMLTNMTEEEWDAVMKVHLKGTFCPSRWAASYWRERFKETNQPTGGRIISTSSGSGLFGNAGQTNYAAAKAGIASFTIVAAMELARYGITVNAVAPGARTRMTENLMGKFGGSLGAPQDAAAKAAGIDPMAPEHVSPLVVWLASDEASEITGQVFESAGGRVERLQGWTIVDEVSTGGDVWDPAALGKEILRWYQEKPARPAGILGARVSS